MKGAIRNYRNASASNWRLPRLLHLCIISQLEIVIVLTIIINSLEPRHVAWLQKQEIFMVRRTPFRFTVTYRPTRPYKFAPCDAFWF
ncbi:hypothetical protein DFR37_105318 [Eoetvoesiella caeni]|uniref:Uncharacterized protein n=1 Tax=Eoetvoesiella caeni TaxID=645616 RepID=A0A366HD83_9BURK|nr:hypothetical protein DFR37_105318 [Eoetvoesiella caeni]